MFGTPSSVKSHRTSALINGIVIGLGVTTILGGVPLGILPLIVGIAAELWQRNRVSES